MKLPLMILLSSILSLCAQAEDKSVGTSTFFRAGKVNASVRIAGESARAFFEALNKKEEQLLPHDFNALQDFDEQLVAAKGSVVKFGANVLCTREVIIDVEAGKIVRDDQNQPVMQWSCSIPFDNVKTGKSHVYLSKKNK